MTESESIAKFKRTSVLWESATNKEIVEAVKVAIQALEEVQEYRALESKLNGISVEQVVNGFINQVEKETHEGYEKGRILTNAEADDWNAYRAIGTVEELKSMKENGSFSGSELAQIAVQLNQLKEYKKIGAIERFRELIEKAEPKKPIYSDFDKNELEEIIPYKSTCPTCGFEFEFGTWNDEENHHCECGQHMDWQ